ncbi:MAG: hypothetical protein AB1450_00005 [Pseudomonadota bacterium]
MNTKSSLVGDRIFVVDTDELEKLIAREADAISYQKTQDNVFEYLKQR